MKFFDEIYGRNPGRFVTADVLFTDGWEGTLSSDRVFCSVPNTLCDGDSKYFNEEMVALGIAC
jgi:hypothetical protein